MSWYPCINEDSGGGVLEIVEWSSGSDEQIVAMLEAHYNGDIDIHDYWAVGDTRQVTLSAMTATGVGESQIQQNVDYVLSNVGGKYLSDGVTECAFQVDQVKCLRTVGYMNSTAVTTGAWRDCARRTWCNNVYKNAIPETLRGIFKEFINQSGQGNGIYEGTYDTNDYFALRAEIEVNGANYQSVPDEGSQVTYYETSSNRIKKVINTANIWWLRSSTPGYNKCFSCVETSGSVSGGYSAATDRGIAPFGVI